MRDHKDMLVHVAGRLSRQLANRLREELEPLGLLPAQFTALAEIALDEGLTQKTLVERLGLEQPGVARTLTGLEADGWIERKTIAGRSQSLHLTDKARGVLPQAVDAAYRMDRQLLGRLTRTERAHLLDQLAELSEAG